MIVDQDDSLMAQYGIPSVVDTFSVCENWLGTDYTVRADRTGSSEWGVAAPDSSVSVEYGSGVVSGYNADGSANADGTSVGATSFDFVRASDALRQASYDDPYYGVYASDGGNMCVPTAGQSCPLSSTKSDGKFTNHGLGRRGVRALVDSMPELGRGAKGERRFRGLRGRAEWIVSVDAETQLLVGEETREGGRTSKTTHYWRRVAGGYARDRTEIDDTDEVEGKKVASRAVITFTDVVVP
jgi:hypothetical protein